MWRIVCLQLKGTQTEDTSLISLDRFEQVGHHHLKLHDGLLLNWQANRCVHLQVVSAFALSNKNDLIRDDYHKLMRAFRALDPENKGYIDAELFGSLMSARGEAFSSQETGTMLRFCNTDHVSHQPCFDPSISKGFHCIHACCWIGSCALKCSFHAPGRSTTAR